MDRYAAGEVQTDIFDRSGMPKPGNASYDKARRLRVWGDQP